MNLPKEGGGGLNTFFFLGRGGLSIRWGPKTMKIINFTDPGGAEPPKPLSTENGLKGKRLVKDI